MQSIHDNSKTHSQGQDIQFDPALFPGIERRQLFRIWQQTSQGKTLAHLASILGVASSTLSRTLDNDRMLVHQHTALVEAGVPEALLPRPEDVKPGPKPKQ